MVLQNSPIQKIFNQYNKDCSKKGKPDISKQSEMISSRRKLNPDLNILSHFTTNVDLNAN